MSIMNWLGVAIVALTFSILFGVTAAAQGFWTAFVGWVASIFIMASFVVGIILALQ